MVAHGTDSRGGTKAARGRGRPRSGRAQRAALDAAWRLLDRGGYGAVTMEGIADAAGVGKMTLYRWWASKAEVVFEALRERVDKKLPAGGVGEGNLERDLARYARRGAGLLEEGLGPILRGLMAEAQLNPEFREVFRGQFLEGRHEALRSILVAAQERGELPAGVDLQFLMEVVFGVMWYRLLVQGKPADPRLARNVVDLVLRFRPGPLRNGR
jgi:AcrR family transcriptional regulator